MAYQILNPGMLLWFSRDGDAVAGYSTFGGVRVVAGAPVCAEDRLYAAAAELEADANARGERVLFFGAGSRLERAYAGRREHALVRLGAQPVWDPREWIEIVRRKASLRAQLHRAANKGVWIAQWPAERARGSPVLRGVLRRWLATRGLPPLSFLVTPDILDDLADRRVFVASRGDRVVAFLVATPVPARRGWLVEEWPRAPEAPNGTTHLLVDAAMRTFAAEGSAYATLGLAPLAERAGGEARGHPAWLRGTLRWARAHGRRFYNFQGLEAFKAGMDPPRWEAIFAIAQGPRFTPGMLRAVAGVFSAGAPERLFVVALGRAVAEELRRARRRMGARVAARASHAESGPLLAPSPGVSTRGGEG